MLANTRSLLSYTSLLCSLIFASFIKLSKNFLIQSLPSFNFLDMDSTNQPNNQSQSQPYFSLLNFPYDKFVSNANISFSQMSSFSSQPTSPSVGAASQPEKTQRERRNWSASDDLVLISGWLYTSKDVIIGNDQSFQEPDVINIMFHRTPEIISATLPGFQRFRLKGRLYPCIAPSEKGEVHGKLLMGLTSDELENLDAVEGNEFERVTVGVVRNDNSEKMAVKTYIWINKDDPDMCGEWDFEEWKRLHMNKFTELFKKVMEWNKNSNGMGRDDFSHVLRKDLSDETPSS